MPASPRAFLQPFAAQHNKHVTRMKLLKEKQSDKRWKFRSYSKSEHFIATFIKTALLPHCIGYCIVSQVIVQNPGETQLSQLLPHLTFPSPFLNRQWQNLIQILSKMGKLKLKINIYSSQITGSL